MSVETVEVQPVSYERRKEVCEQLAGIMTGGTTSYFDEVIRPNLLPEEVPDNLPQNVTWIGTHRMESVTYSKGAIGDLLHVLIDMGDLLAEDAVICAETLQIDCFYDTRIYALNPRSVTEATAELPVPATVSRLPERRPTDMFGGEAVIIPFPVSAHEAMAETPTNMEAPVVNLWPRVPDARIYSFPDGTDQSSNE